MLKQLLLCVLLVSIITDAKFTTGKRNALKKRFMKRALKFKNTIAYRKGADCDDEFEDCSDASFDEEHGEDEYDLASNL